MLAGLETENYLWGNLLLSPSFLIKTSSHLLLKSLFPFFLFIRIPLTLDLVIQSGLFQSLM